MLKLLFLSYFNFINDNVVRCCNKKNFVFNVFNFFYNTKKNIFLQKKKQFLFNTLNNLNYKNIFNMYTLVYLTNVILLKNTKYCIDKINQSKIITLNNNWLHVVKTQHSILLKFIHFTKGQKINFFRKTNSGLLFLNKLLDRTYCLLISLNFIVSKKTYYSIFKGSIFINFVILENLNYNLSVFDLLKIKKQNTFDVVLLFLKKFKKTTVSNKSKYIFYGNLIFVKNYEINFLSFTIVKATQNTNILYSSFLFNLIRFLNWRTYAWLL